LKLTLDQKGFYADGKPVAAGNASIVGLAKQLFLRKVKLINFSPDISPSDITGLLFLLTMEAYEVRNKGGAEKVLVIKGVKGILLNEMTYDDLKTLEEELEEEIETGDEDAKEPGDEDESGEEASAGDEEEAVDPDSIRGLLPRLKNEKDPMMYNDLSVRINEQAGVATQTTSQTDPGDEAFGDVFEVMTTYLEHKFKGSGLPEAIREKAAAALEELLLTDNLKLLIIKIGGSEGVERKAVEELLLLTGVEGMKRLLDALIDSQDFQVRRNIFNTIIRFGDASRDEVVRRLADDRWFAVRQMVSLLGEIGGAESVEGLESAYGHSDVRVKKEVLKSLARIPSPKSRKLLLEALKDDDYAIQGQAIISLGILKDGAAIPALGDIATMRDAFAEKVDQKKEAVKALGMIGTERSVPYLTKVLLKKGWFGKKEVDELRNQSAISLGKIRGENAMAALEKALKGSSGALYNTCKRALGGTKQQNNNGKTDGKK
jgi:HEAT repeat protein